MHKTEYLPANTMDEAAALAPWAFKIIKWMDGFIAFDGPMAAHLWNLKRTSNPSRCMSPPRQPIGGDMRAN